MAAAGLIESKKRRHFGAVVSIYNSTEAGMDDADGEGKYTIVCEDHGYCISVSTLKLARFHAPFFDCEFCTGVAQADCFYEYEG